ncbi:4Fe-4S binding protein [Anaerotalea alkaliphila]|uniref:4Fe-4S binding protein n=1 Tax=Anaerotalea alkaliphila TaxID=2662126 RepID=A0A7X5HXZ6_9FIRM|nr:4Fe-4S binding protein [Anaerotalea alkaliphila]NDL68685.1 4Fe-4S binding protein [Anaerotalea alkaliphila]
MNKTTKDRLYIVTILFFALGFFNIAFAWLGLVCFTLPFVLLAKDKQKTWCKHYCPRSKLLTLAGKAGKVHRPIPALLRKAATKRFVLAYFIVNMTVAALSTVMVALSGAAPMEKLRFLLAFQLPWQMPDLLALSQMPGWVVHGSFRIYSMFMTTTVIGLVLGYFYKPRTWCTICPVNTISDMALAGEKRESAPKQRPVYTD